MAVRKYGEIIIREMDKNDGESQQDNYPAFAMFLYKIKEPKKSFVSEYIVAIEESPEERKKRR